MMEQLRQWLIEGNQLKRKDPAIYRARVITVGEILDWLDAWQFRVDALKNLECLCCGDAYAPCDDADHTKAGMCCFCTVGLHEPGPGGCRPSGIDGG